MARDATPRPVPGSVIPVPAFLPVAPSGPLADEHSVLLWQTCAYAEDVTDAARSGQRLSPALDALLGFLHYRLLPYLTDEERQLPATALRDERLTRLLVADHGRLRYDVDNIETSRTRSFLALAVDVLVERLDRHVRREESWATDPATGTDGTDGVDGVDLAAWALPLLLGDDIDLDALPVEHRDSLVLQRLQWMHPGDTLLLRASHDLHPLWRRQHALSSRAHGWVYEQAGPTDWRARITRRDGC
jgi:uncharacterized protein (DUF2249 family)